VVWHLINLHGQGQRYSTSCTRLNKAVRMLIYGYLLTLSECFKMNDRSNLLRGWLWYMIWGCCTTFRNKSRSRNLHGVYVPVGGAGLGMPISCSVAGSTEVVARTISKSLHQWRYAAKGAHNYFDSHSHSRWTQHIGGHEFPSSKSCLGNGAFRLCASRFWVPSHYLRGELICFIFYRTGSVIDGLGSNFFAL
jgi:hypothetical protein